MGRLRLGLELHGEVAGVGFRDRGKAHLQAGAAGGAFDLGLFAQDVLDVVEDAVGLGERTARGHDVVEDKAAFVHLRQQVGAEGFVAGPCADDQYQAGHPQPQWPGQGPVEHSGDARAECGP